MTVRKLNSGTIQGKQRKEAGPVRAAGFLFVLVSGLYQVLKLLDVTHETGDAMPLKVYLLLFSASLLLAAAAGWGFLSERGRSVPLHRLFFVAGLCLGCLNLLVLPGLSAPDEVSHYATAYRLSSRFIGAPDLTEDLGLISMRAEDYLLEDLSGTKTLDDPDDEEPPAEILGNPVRYATYRAIADWDRRYVFDPSFVSSGLPDVRTTPVMYVPQALGIALARVLSLRAPVLVFVGRFLNLMVFLILVSVAICRAPFGKELFFGAGLLPMSLHLASSMSYDAGLMGTVFLFTAEMLRLAYGTIAGRKESSGTKESPQVTWRNLPLLCLLAAAFGPCKLVYSVLVFLFLLIPVSRFGKPGKYLSFLLLLLALSLSMAAVNRRVIGGYLSAPVQEHADAAALTELPERGYPVAELIHRPVFIVRMVCDTFSLKSGELLLGMTGMWLGNLDPLLGTPFFAALLFLFGLLVLSLRASGETGRPLNLRARLWCALLLLGVALLTAGAMLVSWTTRGAGFIEGIQGRYFLPVLPLALLLLDRIPLAAERDVRREVLYAFVCLDLFTLFRVFALACMRL